jgi:hypothetical protein
MTDDSTRPQPSPLGWYTTSRPMVCDHVMSRSHECYLQCRQRVTAGESVLMTGPTTEAPRGQLLCVPCGHAFLDTYLEPLPTDVVLELSERCRARSSAWKLDIDLALGQGPLTLREAL